MLCLVWTGTSSCSDKKNSADKQEQGVSTVLLRRGGSRVHHDHDAHDR